MEILYDNYKNREKSEKRISKTRRYHRAHLKQVRRIYLYGGNKSRFLAAEEILKPLIKRSRDSFKLLIRKFASCMPRGAAPPGRNAAVVPPG